MAAKEFLEQLNQTRQNNTTATADIIRLLALEIENQTHINANLIKLIEDSIVAESKPGSLASLKNTHTTCSQAIADWSNHLETMTQDECQMNLSKIAEKLNNTLDRLIVVNERLCEIAEQLLPHRRENTTAAALSVHSTATAQRKDNAEDCVSYPHKNWL